MVRRLFLLLLITLVGAFLRLYQIDRLPPGPSFDAAFYGLDAYAILDGARPIFLATNSGREALFSYLVAALFALIGPGQTAIYAASALVGIATIPAVYLAAREMLRDEADAAVREAAPLLAALALAISWWHVQLSRQGLRAILVPLAASLTVWLLFRALRTRSAWDVVGLGVVLGLAMYTYQAARLLPLLVAVGFVGAAAYAGGWRATRWRDLAVALGVAVVVALPLAVYAVQRPAEFNARARDAWVVNPSGDVNLPVIGLSESVREALALYTFQGDESPIANIPYRPAFDSFLAAAFLVGIGVAVWRWRRFPYLFTLVWLALITVPAAVAGLGSAEKRAAGSAPAAATLIALGIVVPWLLVRDWAGARPGRLARVAPPLFAALLGVGLLSSALTTYHDYFVVWGGEPELFSHFEAGQAAVGRYLAGLPADERIFLSTIPPDHVGLQMEARQRPGVRGYNGRECLLLAGPQPSGATYIVVPGEDRRGLRNLGRAYPTGQEDPAGPVYLGSPYFVAFRVPPQTPPDLSPDRPSGVVFDGRLTLPGYDLSEDDLKPGGELDVTLYWQALRATDSPATVFVHLIPPHAAGQSPPPISQVDRQPCAGAVPTTTWQAGDTLRETYRIAIPDRAPAGDYQVVIGLYDTETQQRLPAANTAGQPVGDTVTLGMVRVTRQDQP